MLQKHSVGSNLINEQMQHNGFGEVSIMAGYTGEAKMLYIMQLNI